MDLDEERVNMHGSCSRAGSDGVRASGFARNSAGHH